jgi:hypothetical protein
MSSSTPSPRFGARVRAEAAHVARSLATFGPARGRRWPLALQAGLAMTVPIVALAASGYPHLALLSATGAFAVIYGGWLRPRERARVAPLVALALWVCAAAEPSRPGAACRSCSAGCWSRRSSHRRWRVRSRSSRPDRCSSCSCSVCRPRSPRPTGVCASSIRRSTWPSSPPQGLSPAWSSRRRCCCRGTAGSSRVRWGRSFLCDGRRSPRR